MPSGYPPLPPLLPPDGRSPLPPDGSPFCRPHYEQKAEMARWLAHQLDWGVVSTTSR